MTSSSPSPQTSMLLYWHENPYDNQNYQINGRTLFFGMALFSIVLFFALLTLYIHRSCFLPQDPINLHSPQPPLALGLDPAEIRSLPVVLCRRETTTTKEEEEKECCICLGDFEEGEKMKVLPPCLHCYHCQCVDRWLQNESSCPLCRVSIRVDSSCPRK